MDGRESDEGLMVFGVVKDHERGAVGGGGEREADIGQRTLDGGADEVEGPSISSSSTAKAKREVSEMRC